MKSTAIVHVENYPLVGGPERREGERSEPDRSGGAPTRGAATPSSQNPAPAYPEVVAKPVRRRFSAEYKLRILREAERCARPGELGALLRREGLYSSLLTTWRRQRDQGSLMALAAKRRGRKSEKSAPLVRRNAELERENRRLTEKLRKAQIIIDVQKKVQALLSMPDEEGKP